MPRLYLLTDCAGSWPFVTEDELAERLAGGAVVAQLVGIFDDDSEGWMRLGDEITRVVGRTEAPGARNRSVVLSNRGRRPQARRDV
jgi:hypothetical protein